MPKRGCKTTSVNIENNLYALSIEEGIELTAFVNRCLALFFEVPENPHDKLIKEKSQYAVLRLKQKYEREIMGVIKEYESQSKMDQAVQEREAELIQFGEYLKRTSAYPVFKICLLKHDVDEDTLDIVTSEVNKMNGQRYNATDLWNKAINWFKKYEVSA